MVRTDDSNPSDLRSTRGPSASCGSGLKARTRPCHGRGGGSIPLYRSKNGLMAERQGDGLQNRKRWFDSNSSL